MARKQPPRPALEATPRHLWLAGLGLAAMAGRQATSTAALTARRAAQSRQRAIAAAAQAQSRIVVSVDGLRSNLEANATRINAAVEGLLAPLIAKLKPSTAKRAPRRGRKPVAKATRRSTAKKAVKRTRRA